MSLSTVLFNMAYYFLISISKLKIHGKQELFIVYNIRRKSINVVLLILLVIEVVT